MILSEPFSVYINFTPNCRFHQPASLSKQLLQATSSHFKPLQVSKLSTPRSLSTLCSKWTTTKKKKQFLFIVIKFFFHLVQKFFSFGGGEISAGNLSFCDASPFIELLYFRPTSLFNCILITVPAPRSFRSSSLSTVFDLQIPLLV